MQTNNIKHLVPSKILINGFIILNLFANVLDQLKFYMKCHKSKYFRVIFHLLKHYQDQNLVI